MTSRTTPLNGESLRIVCRAYRLASIAYERAFERGDVKAIEETFSRMQEIAGAFLQGTEWARRENRIRAGLKGKR